MEKNRRVKKPVKRLERRPDRDGHNELRHVRMTEKVVDESTLCELLPKRLFLIHPRLLSARFCYVACWKVVLEYAVSYFKKNRADHGTIVFVVDGTKGCAVIEDDIELKLIRSGIDADLCEKDAFTQEQAEKKAIVDARWKVLMARYKRPPELETKAISKFYRPYYEVEYSYGGKIKKYWIPADEYGNYFVYN